MKRNLRLCLLALLLSTPFCLMAQSPARYGFLNRAAVIAILPETARVRAHLDSLRSKYEAERATTKRLSVANIRNICRYRKICPKPFC